MCAPLPIHRFVADVTQHSYDALDRLIQTLKRWKRWGQVLH